MKKLLVPLIVALLFAGCSVNNTEESTPEIKNKLPRSLSATEVELVEAGNTFNYNLFQQIAAVESQQNVIVSPLSVSMALGMTLNGATGKTKEAMKAALEMEGMDIEQINQSYQSLTKLLLELDPKVQINIANSLWSHQGFPIKADFSNALKTFFNARAQELNFKDPASADVINNWVSENTKGNIDKIIADIPDSIVLYLINAVYFNGDWRHQFDPDKTRKQNFHLADGSTIQANMMQQKVEINYLHSDEVIMAALPYGNTLYNMTLLMPASDQQPLGDFIQQSLNASNMQEWTGQLSKGEVRIKMPKFKLDYKTELNEILKAMGMGIAFNPNKANFSQLSPVPTFISKTKHKAMITVDEEGTEAAAATVVGMQPTSAGPTISFDRPFIFMIREKVSGTILFIGQMHNPTK